MNRAVPVVALLVVAAGAAWFALNPAPRSRVTVEDGAPYADADETKGIVTYLRSLEPKSQGDVDFHFPGRGKGGKGKGDGKGEGKPSDTPSETPDGSTGKVN